MPEYNTRPACALRAPVTACARDASRLPFGHAEDLLRLSRTRGAILWMRAHFDGRLRVEIRAAEAGSCVVLVRRGDEPIREARLAVEPGAARGPADALLLELLPHQCGDAECGAWVELAAGRKPASS